MNTFQLTVKADYFCEVYLDSLLTAVVKKNEPVILDVVPGEHHIKCVCTTDPEISIENNINVIEDTVSQISFEDLIFAHPELIRTANHYYCFIENFPRLQDAWKDIDYFNQGCDWNDYDVEVQKHIEVYKNGVYGYVNILGEEDLDAYYVITDNGKYGFAHGLGRIVVPCIYDLPEHLKLSDEELMALEESDYEHYWRIIHEPDILICENTSVGLVHQNGKWGFIDLKTGTQSPVVYERIGDHRYSTTWDTEYVPVGKDGLWGVFNKFKNTEVVECKYKDIKVCSALVYGEREIWDNYKQIGADCLPHDIKYTLEGKSGLFTLSGESLVPAIYDNIERYCNGVSRVSRDGKWGFIDESGAEIIPCQYDQAGDFNDGIAGVRKGDKWGIINNAGQVIYPFELDFCCWSVQGYAVINIAGKSGVIDASGKIIIPCEYDKIRPETWDSFDSAESPFKWYEYVDEDTGEKMCSGRSAQRWFYDFYNYFLVQKHGAWGAYNLEGEMILPYIYTNFKSFDKQLVGVRETDKKVYLSSTCEGFNNEAYILLNEDYILIKSDNIWRLYKTTGELAINDTFESYKSYRNLEARLLAVKKEEKWAIINLKTGKYTSSFEYDTIYDFYEGLATVKRDGLNGFIDENGREVIPCKYKSAWMFREGTADVSEGFIDKYGNIIS